MADIQKVPGVSYRPKDAAPLQIGGDWPGVFIRGDEAQGWASLIEEACRCLPEGRLENALRRDLGSYAGVLRSCWVNGNRADAVEAWQRAGRPTNG